MIQSITIKNFKSFREASLPLAPLTLLIGANASGKSNAIEAMQLLSWLASGRRLGDLLVAIRDQELSLRGTFNDLTYAGDEFSLGCDLLPPLSFSIMLQVNEAGLRILEERLESPEAEPEQSPPAAASRLRQSLEDILFLDPHPRRMRDYSFLQDQKLQGDGAALSSVLYRLSEEGKKEEILGFIRSLPEQDIRDVTFLEGPRGEVMVQLHETFGGKATAREAALLSDGTLRVLAVAAALLSVPEGSLVVIEEIDNGVHPSRAELLLGNVQRIARERQLRVLLTTHNPALLDAIPAAAVPDTVACYRDPEEGDSRLVRLEDLQSYPELVAQGPVGRLVTKGILDRFLKVDERRSGAEKVDQGLAWISEFRRRASSP
jgi:predicted ATPase